MILKARMTFGVKSLSVLCLEPLVFWYSCAPCPLSSLISSLAPWLSASWASLGHDSCKCAEALQRNKHVVRRGGARGVCEERRQHVRESLIRQTEGCGVLVIVLGLANERFVNEEELGQGWSETKSERKPCANECWKTLCVLKPLWNICLEYVLSWEHSAAERILQ